MIKVSSNGLFLTPDAEVYSSMILDRRPRRIIEVGSGFSTLTARKTIQYAGYPTKLVASDPCPRTNVQAVTDELIPTRFRACLLTPADIRQSWPRIA